MQPLKPGLFSVRTRLLAEVAKWSCPHQDQRPQIARVLFDGKHMVATDGHRMVVAPCETDLQPFALERMDCAVLAAAQREITKDRRADLTFVTVSEGKATIDIDAGSRVLTVRTSDGKDFPPWRQLFEGLRAETPSPPEHAFEPCFLAAIDQVLEAVDGALQRTVIVKAWTAEPGPMLFEGYGIRFLIMPKRSQA